MLNSLSPEKAQDVSAEPSTNNLGQDVLAQAVLAANLQVEPKKPAQRRRKQVTLRGGEHQHDENCPDPLKCTLRWELAKISRKRTYDRQHQENRSLKRKLGETTAEKEHWKKKFNEVNEQNIRLNALLFVHNNQASETLP